MPELIVHVDSLDIFPVSWCETNGYPLLYPIKPKGWCSLEGKHIFVWSATSSVCICYHVEQSIYCFWDSERQLKIYIYFFFNSFLLVEKQRRIAVVQPEKQ